jgi:hypothetical protein
MLAILPLISLIASVACLIAHGHTARKACIYAAVFIGLVVTVSTELLSIFKAINQQSVTAVWLVLDVALIIYYIKSKKSHFELRHKLSPVQYVFLAGLILIFSLTFLVAVVVPTNNFDSMTYHMARVMHWIQNMSVAHYPTNITRQIYFAPWSEFAIMHLQILCDGDRFANLVQWSAMAGSIIGVTLIAEEFGASTRTQLFAAVLAATIPMGILQASTTQNDYAVSFWLVCFVYFGMLYRDRPALESALGAACSLGLAILTKGTAYLVAGPFVLWFGYAGIKALRWRFAGQLLLVSMVILAINSGHYLRNYQLWGNPIYVDTDNRITNEAYGLSVIVSNIVRNSALHIGTPFDGINKFNESAIVRFHEIIGIDPDDPATTLEQFWVRDNNRSEDAAGNLLHFILMLVTVGALIWKIRIFSGKLLIYACSMLFVFVIYCACLKWNSYASRYHLPLFILWAPIIAIVLSSFKSWQIAYTVSIMLFIYSVPYLIFASYRPIVSYKSQPSILSTDRLSHYFSRRPQLKAYYLNDAISLKNSGCQNIGLVMGMDSWEYPFWVAMKKLGGTMPRIEHINVHNQSATIHTDFTPCASYVTYDW